MAHPWKPRWMLAFVGLALILIAPAVLADTAPAAGAATTPTFLQSSLGTGCDESDFEPAVVDLKFTPVGNGAVWTSGGSCTAQLTCDSNCVKHCSGTTCTVGSNYVECDGQQYFCPSCNISQYPGYPQCAWRLCTWCVCINQGGTPSSCCEW